MVSLLIGLARFWLAIRMAWRDPSFRLLAALTASLLLVGTWVFHKVEGWTYLDSFYIFAGFGLLVALLTLFANALIQSVRDSREKLHLQLMRAHEKKVPSGAAAAQPDTAEPPVAQKEQLP